MIFFLKWNLIIRYLSLFYTLALAYTASVSKICTGLDHLHSKTIYDSEYRRLTPNYMVLFQNKFQQFGTEFVNRNRRECTLFFSSLLELELKVSWTRKLNKLPTSFYIMWCELLGIYLGKRVLSEYINLQLIGIIK